MHLLTYVSLKEGNQFNVLKKSNENERRFASRMILAAPFCSLKMMFKFRLDVDVEMLAPCGRAVLMTAF